MAKKKTKIKSKESQVIDTQLSAAIEKRYQEFFNNTGLLDWEPTMKRDNATSRKFVHTVGMAWYDGRNAESDEDVSKCVYLKELDDVIRMLLLLCVRYDLVFKALRDSSIDLPGIKQPLDVGRDYVDHLLNRSTPFEMRYADCMTLDLPGDDDILKLLVRIVSDSAREGILCDNAEEDLEKLKNMLLSYSLREPDNTTYPKISESLVLTEGNTRIKTTISVDDVRCYMDEVTYALASKE